MTAGPASPVDTIVAAATAAGPGARAIVRVSGPDAHALAAAVLMPASPGAPDTQADSSGPAEPADVTSASVPPPGRCGPARLDLGGGATLPLELLAWRAPRSATGEDVVELHLPGWPPVVAELVRRLVRAGARPAARGEFTRRALASGRLDLSQAQAVLSLATAVDAEQVTAAAAQLTGAVARQGRQLRGALLDVLARLEAHVDFEDEDAEGVDPSSLREAISAAADLAGTLADDAGRCPPADGETDVVLLGAPNAGKSSLVMALAPGARLATSPVAGTTRDAIEVRVIRGERAWRLLDGPGVDQGDGGDVLGPLDRQAMALFLEQLPEGALVLHVRDASAPWPDPGAERRAAAAGARPQLEVITKLDLVPRGSWPPGACPVCARTGEGLEALWAALSAAVPVAPRPAAATRGEAEAARAVQRALTAALADEHGGELPLLALALREAMERLERESEQPLDTTEAVLDRIFARFCIGK